MVTDRTVQFLAGKAEFMIFLPKNCLSSSVTCLNSSLNYNDKMQAMGV